MAHNVKKHVCNVCENNEREAFSVCNNEMKCIKTISQINETVVKNESNEIEESDREEKKTHRRGREGRKKVK